jgi:hypothetical protein
VQLVSDAAVVDGMWLSRARHARQLALYYTLRVAPSPFELALVSAH